MVSRIYANEIQREEITFACYLKQEQRRNKERQEEVGMEKQELQENQIC
jgi:hypothetical protein